MNKKIIVCILIISVIAVIIITFIPSIGFFIVVTKDDRMSKKDIVKYVTENQKAIETAVTDFINENTYQNGDITEIIDIPKCKEILNITIENNIVNFDCGGYGMGSATGYTGFYYVLSGKKFMTDNSDTTDLSTLGYRNIKFITDGAGWLWKETDGDNSVYIENIVGDFYYYLEEY